MYNHGYETNIPKPFLYPRRYISQVESEPRKREKTFCECCTFIYYYSYTIHFNLSIYGKIGYNWLLVDNKKFIKTLFKSRRDRINAIRLKSKI